MREKNVAILGLGYVGLTLAVSMSESGFNVTGIESNKNTFESLSEKKPHFYEPKLESKLKKQINSKNLRILNEIPKINNFGIFIICVGTPLVKNQPNLNYIKDATIEVAKKFKNKSTIIYRSTVPIGTTEKILKPIIDKYNKKNKIYDLCFCPERTAQGQALVELKKMPQIVGGLNLQSSNNAKKIFKKITPNVIVVRNILTAEMIKLVDNSQRDVFFAYANEIANISNEYDISSDEVLRSASLNYPRTKLYIPGPVGGPCLSKDSHILLSNTKKNKNHSSLILAARKINESLHISCFNFLKNNTDLSKKNITIGFYGIAFKGNPITDDIRGGLIHDILKILKNYNKNINFIGYDPNVDHKLFNSLKLKKIKRDRDLFLKTNIVLNLNNNKSFKNINLINFSKIMRNKGLIYDFWNNFNSSKVKLSNKVRYVSYGSEKVI